MWVYATNSILRVPKFLVVECVMYHSKFLMAALVDNLKGLLKSYSVQYILSLALFELFDLWSMISTSSSMN